MWIIHLTSKDGTQTKFYFTKVGSYSIGRKETDILIQGDKAISRHHADLVVEMKNGKPQLSLKDESKTGTLHNNQRYTGQSVVIQPGDIIELGASNTRLEVQKEPFKFCCSGIRRAERQNIKEHVSDILCEMVTDVTEATHLVMTKLDVTVKVMQSLLLGIPVVSVDYIKAIKDRDSQWENPLPDHVDFLPPLGDPSIKAEFFASQDSEGRQKLFSGTTFVFCDEKQHKNASIVISGASGDSTYVKDITASFIEENPDAIFVSPLVPGADWTANKDLLEEHNMKIVQQNDIGFAILNVKKIVS
mmetsp:Transcript_9493/g.10490  ORF Transcript_9493/g.10490 Transcript_9493/m.10490 type:complete len:303 (-) Transcript_9493:90-998(-)